MKTMKKWLALLLLSLLLVACSAGVPDEMRALMVDTDEIPAGWLLFNESKAQDWGGDLYNIGFAYGTEPYDPAIEHQLIVYTNPEAAAQGFLDYSSYMYVEGWGEPAEADFTPSDPTDMFAFQCADQALDKVLTKNCLVLQQHGNYVSALGVRMGGPLTFEVVNILLRSLDAKLNAK